MADEPKVDETTGNPISEPVTKTGEDGMPVEEKADNHRHDWQGMRAGGVQYQVCAFCGKQRERES